MPGSANPSCRECDLWRTCRVVCMAPTGPERPRFVVVGEAPGQHEDEEGIPFVGPAGKLLWETLAEYGIRRDEAHVTNVVKCRPPENRTPKRSEITACLPYLRAELEYLKSQKTSIILALGATAYRALGGKGGITEAAGVAYQWEGFTVFPALHPAAALRSPQAMQAFKEQMAHFARLLNGGPGRGLDTTVELIDAPKGDALWRMVVKEPRHAELASFDLETTGLDEQAPGASIICISVSFRPGHAYVMLVDHPASRMNHAEVKAILKELFRPRRNGPIWIAHNGRFDVRWLRAKGLPAPDLRRDTILMAHLLDENMPKNVEAVAARYLGRPGWKALMADHFAAIQRAMERGQAIPWPPLDALVPYAGIDADVELRLASLLWEKLSPAEKRVHDFLLQVGEVLNGVEQTGVHIARDDLTAVERQGEAEVDRAVQDFAKAAGLSPDECNLGSWKWLAEVLFEKLDLPVVELTDSGGPATGEHTLRRLMSYAPKVIEPLLRYRKWTKYLGSYIRPWRTLLDDRSRLRSSYNLTGTVTGRLSCTNLVRRGMSLHQIPRDSEIRSLISAPQGRVLISADYSQLELRVAAAIANEPRMLEAYQKGEDLHKLTAATVMQKPLEQVTKEDRQRAKAVNFGFLYGMGAKKFVRYAFDEYGLEFSLEEAEQIRERFFRLYRGLRPWHQQTEEFVRRHGYIRSPLGRTRHLPDVHSPDPGVQSEAIRQAINFPVQSTASDITLAAMVLFHRWLAETGAPARIVGQVHDSILVEVDENHADDMAQEIRRIMRDETPPYLQATFGWRCTVPLDAEVQIGKHWGKPQKVLDS